MRFALTSRSLGAGSLAGAIHLAAELGLDGLEVRLEDIWRQGESPQDLATMARHSGLDLSAYAPVDGLNILAPDLDLRERSMRWAVEAVAQTRQLGARIVTITPGHLIENRQTLATGWRPLISAARTLAKAAEHQGIALALENPAPGQDRVLTHIVDAQSLLREVDSPALGLCLNLSHLAASDEDAVDWLHGVDRVFQVRIAPDRPRRALQPVIAGAKTRSIFAQRLEAAGFTGQIVYDDPQPTGELDRLIDQLAQIKRWFWIRPPAPPRRASVGRRSGTSA